jgi:hypothetical protein
MLSRSLDLTARAWSSVSRAGRRLAIARTSAAGTSSHRLVFVVGIELPAQPPAASGIATTNRNLRERVIRMCCASEDQATPPPAAEL